MTVINTNVNALLTQSALKSNERHMTVAMERLSTGARINSAKDDAAGLAISSRMNSQIRGLDMAVRNAHDGISMIQAADGATIEISNMLQRMRELSVQAQNGTNKDTDLEYLQKEFWQLQAEIERIADNTQWNAKNILDGTPGSNGTVSYQIGANANQSITMNFGNFQTKFSGVVYAIAAVTHGSDKFTLSGHGFVAGDQVYYEAKGGTAVGGLADTTSYWVTAVSGNDFKLATSYDNAIAGSFQALSGDGNDNQTLTRVSTYGTDTAPNNIDATTINIKTAAGAATALAAVDTAIKGLDSQRATYGSVINRLQYALDNLTNVSMNTSASKSRIQDADYARETSELARTQIIQQAATAMLSQANTLPQTVLQLLQQ